VDCLICIERTGVARSVRCVAKGRRRTLLFAIRTRSNLGAI